VRRARMTGKQRQSKATNIEKVRSAEKVFIAGIPHWVGEEPQPTPKTPTTHTRNTPKGAGRDERVKPE